jgi:hypothetical protein
MLLDVLRVIGQLPRVEWVRRRWGPAAAVRYARDVGATRFRRNDDGRARLTRFIRLIDRVFPTGPNCYRRVLLEMALDGGAAREPMMMGFRASGGPQSGHAWLASQPPGESYDAVVSV